jgi:eukaryotic-like serine/threonine-protein kinase
VTMEMPATGSIVDGRYRIINRVGSGGMADVYCAEDLQLGRNVALKLLHRRFAEDAEFVERFRREASSAAGLQHPNVVSVYDRGQWDGTSYIAMEYVDGETLKRVIVDQAPLPADRAIDLTQQILRAASFAHRRGIVHRDLKPQNVIIDAEGRAKVTDFGIARAGASDMTQTGSIMGTAQYLSPEQAQGHSVSAQSDLYSIGIIVYEMLTGRIPFDGESAVTIALKQVSQAPVPPRALNPAVSPALEAVVLRALEKDPARRFADADEFSQALERARSGEAPPPPPAPTDVTQIVPIPGPMVPMPPPDAYREVNHVEERRPLPPPDERTGRRWWIGLLVALLVAGGIVAALLLLSADKVTVPNVVGAPRAEAEIALKRKGLDTDVTLKESQRPKDSVIGQDPSGGTEIGKGEVVTLTVSAGPGTARVPELQGSPQSEARRTLRRLGFEVDVVREPSDTIPSNRVVGTRPAGGEELERGQTVTLVVSSGKERIAVPTVTGLDVEEARGRLEGAGFQVVTRRQEDKDADPGTVLGQDPPAGQSVPKGSSITLTVAKEPEQVDVPDVIGLDESDATDQLSGAGFRVRLQEDAVDSPDQDGVVLDQDPGPGPADRGSRVTITVGRFNPALNPEPDTGGTGDGTVTTP